MMELQGKLLIATLEMNDDYFNRALIYICEHNENGAMGLMINSPTDMSVMELLVKMDYLMANSREYSEDQLVLCGGPVGEDRGFILHTPTSATLLHSYPVADELSLTTSGDILDTFGRAESPAHFIVCLGCCTWTSGQLEEEISKNYWLVGEADKSVLFETGYFDRWTKAHDLLGLSMIPLHAGRA